jgi:DNA polymerase-1
MNIQTIPRDQKDVKRSFRPKLDAFLSLDYPNIELKLLAWYLDSLGYPSMGEAFRNGLDLHIATAAGIYGLPFDEVTDAQRQVGKRLNFSIVYGGGIPTLVRQGVAADATEALELLRGFHGAWPGIGWQRKHVEAPHGTMSWHIQNRLKERGYITTLWGRHLRPQESHKALNALVQGCAADLMEWALINVDDHLKELGMKSHLVLTVHDNAMLDCAEDELDALVSLVPGWMTYDLVEKVVPISPEPEVSFDTWADLKKWSDIETPTLGAVS